jgi:hypothetical protein
LETKYSGQQLLSPVKRAGGLAGFEVLSRGDRNAHCLSDLTLANREFAQLPQNRDKLPGFTRAAPCPSDQLKLFSASAVERSGVAFCWLLILAKQNK